MDAGRQANNDGDIEAAWNEFHSCYLQTGLIEARISAANMALKMGQDPQCAGASTSPVPAPHCRTAPARTWHPTVTCRQLELGAHVLR
eukprot:1288285-Prymnesium_polylepis.1